MATYSFHLWRVEHASHLVTKLITVGQYNVLCCGCPFHVCQALERLPSWRSILILIDLCLCFPFPYTFMYVYYWVGSGLDHRVCACACFTTWIGQAFFQCGDVDINIPIMSTSWCSFEFHSKRNISGYEYNAVLLCHSSRNAWKRQLESGDMRSGVRLWSWWHAYAMSPDHTVGQ